MARRYWASHTNSSSVSLDMGAFLNGIIFSPCIDQMKVISCTSSGKYEARTTYVLWIHNKVSSKIIKHNSVFISIIFGKSFPNQSEWLGAKNTVSRMFNRYHGSIIDHFIQLIDIFQVNILLIWQRCSKETWQNRKCLPTQIRMPLGGVQAVILKSVWGITPSCCIFLSIQVLVSRLVPMEIINS